MDAAKADIERFVRKYPEKCVNANGRINIRPVRDPTDLNSSSHDRSHVSLLNTSMSLDAQLVNDENRPLNGGPQNQQEMNSSFDLMNSSMESFILGVAGSAVSSLSSNQNSNSTTSNRTPSRRSQRYEISSSTTTTTTNDEEDEDFSSADVGFSRASNFTPAKFAASALDDNGSMSSLPFDKTPGPSHSQADSKDNDAEPEEDFLDLYARISSRRIDDQRGELHEEPICEEDDFSGRPSEVASSNNPEEILDLIVCIQGRRMEDQRASLILPELNVEGMNAAGAVDKLKMKQNGSNGGQDGINEDHLYDLIMSRQADRLDDQRSELGGRPKSCSALPMDIPDLDDVSELVIAMQAGRFETQRAHLKPPTSSDTQLHVSQHGDNDCPPRCVSASANINSNMSG